MMTTTPDQDERAAVLYVCADHGRLLPGLAAERAEKEGRAFAQQQGLVITEVIKDEYGIPDPCRRAGWQRVREMAKTGSAASVIVRWPSSIAPDILAELRRREVRWLQSHGVRVRYTWAPLATTGSETE
ncbi:hypothetical protein [Streptomyces sp. NPDC057545]|uniref:hypothetical protein n=1 Tax=Streptomyces sp. NPDC057545 TaxID=3346164 RepID=UPI00369DCC63